MFNVDALSEQVRLLDGFKLATKSVKEAKTAKLLIGSGNFQAGVLTRSPIMKMNTDVVFQKQNCAVRNPLGGTTFQEVFVDVTKLAVYEDICYDKLEGTYMSQALISTTDDPSEEVLMAEFTKQILDKQIALINLGVEKLIWLGNESLSGATNNLNKISGIKSQVSGVSATTVSGATIAAKLQSLYFAMDEDDRLAEDAYIFVSEAVYEQYTVELWAADRFNSNKDTELKLAGLNIKLFPTPGLSGTREVYATRLSNLQLAFAGSPEVDKIDLWFSKDDNIFKQNAFFSLGIKVIEPSDVKKATV
jgi:hypothetical protein